MRIFRYITSDTVTTAIWMIGLFGGTLTFLRCLKTYPFYWYNDPLLWELPLVFYVLGLLIAVFFWKKLFYGESPFPGAKFLGIISWPLSLTAVCTSLFIFCNGYLDSSVINVSHYSVLQKHKYNNNYRLDMQLTQKPSVINAIEVDERTYLATHPGSRIAVNVKNGYFNIPWVANYKLEDHPSIPLNTEAWQSNNSTSGERQIKSIGSDQFKVHNVLEWFMIATIILFLAGVGGVDVWLIWRAARYIRVKYPDAWAALGIKSPYSFKFVQFSRYKNYLALKDPVLTNIFESKKRFDNITGILFIIILSLLLYLNKYYT